MTVEMTADNCIDIVRPFRNDLERAGLLENVQFIGGIGSAAMVNNGTLILPDDRTIVAPNDLYLPRERDDGNVRDMDVLVLSDDDDVIAEVEGMAEETVDGKLHVSIFGLRSISHVRKQLQHPLFGIKALKTFVSDRYIDEDGNIEKVLFPFGLPMDKEAMETYWLEAGQMQIPVASPPAALMNYSTRSISGLRPKDEAKVQKMAGNIFTKVPDYSDWIESGPGMSQLQLAQVLHSLRGPSNHDRAEPLSIGGVISVDPLPIRALFEHEAFLLREEDSELQQKVMAWARIKSAVLAKAESNGEIVRLYQKWAERIFDSISKNK